MNIICVGGGAASFFFAAEVTRRLPNVRCTILEQGKQVLGKVRISGGGRCNVTHHCFDPRLLVENYPRGREVLEPVFREFGPAETVKWFESRGVKLKTEADGRMFPVTNSSQTIIDCLMKACHRGGVQVKTSAKVKTIKPFAEGRRGYSVELMNGESYKTDIVFVGSGSSKQIWQVLGQLGHRVIEPVASLFTFLIRDERLKNLSGISISDVRVKLNGLITSGPLLITHRGLSGPAVLKMSAFGARKMSEIGYKTTIDIDFIPETTIEEVRKWRDEYGKKLLSNHTITGLPRRLHQSLLDHAQLDGTRKLATLSNRDLDAFAKAIKEAEFHVVGQNRFKEEFVTAGGVDVEEVNLSTFESKVLPNIYMAGEVLNIDAVTGGFNFQAAWSGAWMAARSLGH